jgi:hypothetical protein
MYFKRFFLFCFGIICLLRLNAQQPGLHFIEREGSEQFKEKVKSMLDLYLLTISQGFISNSLFENPNTKKDQPLSALRIRLKDDSLTMPEWSPILICDMGAPPEPMVLMVDPKDSILKGRILFDTLLGASLGWSNITRIKNDRLWKDSDSLECIDLEEFLLPLPCHRDEIYIRYFSNEDINLSWSGYEANGLSFAQTRIIIKDEILHQRAYHKIGCYDPIQMTLEFMHRNTDIPEVTRYLRSLTDLKVKLKVLFPVED